MDALRKVYHNAQGQDFRRTVREVKNKIYNYNEMEQLVREATCNDARTPNESCRTIRRSRRLHRPALPRTCSHRAAATARAAARATAAAARATAARAAAAGTGGTGCRPS